MLTRPNFAVRPSRRLAALAMALTLLPLVGCEAPNALLRKQAKDAMDQGDYAYADQRVAQAVAQDPTDWKSQYYRGLVRLEQNRPLDAQLALEKALSMRHNHPETPAILDALAEALFKQNDRVILYAFLKGACDQYGTPRDFLRQAQYLAKAGDLDGAKVAFTKAVRFWPSDDPAPFLAMADFYEAIGDRQNATIALRRAYSITPNDPRLARRLREHGVTPGPTAVVPVSR